MAPIQTFMFMDFGCDFNNPKKLTEVGFLAVNRSRFLQPRNIEEPATKKVLDLRSNGFTLEIYDEIADFMNEQPKPVCLVSHNGHIFDFPILKRELERLKKAEKLETDRLKKAQKLEAEGLEAERLKKTEKLEAEGLKTEGLEDASAEKRLRNWFEDVLCADSLYIFYDISKSGNIKQYVDELSEQLNNMQVKDSQDIELKEDAADKRLKYTRRAVREIFFGDDPKPPLGYNELGAIYDRVVEYPPMEHHPAANDVYMQFRISHKYNKEFLAWTDDIQYKFAKINATDVRINKKKTY